MVNKPIVGPSVDEWDNPPNLGPECNHGLPLSVNCTACTDEWNNLCLWGELLDEG